MGSKIVRVLAVIFGVAFTGHAVAGTITGRFDPVPQGANIDLTQIGTTDWVHWGLHNEATVNRKSGVPAMISNFRMVGANITSYVVAYQYNDNYNGYTWYDGWKTLETTNTTTGVWAYQAWPPMSQNPMAAGFGFEISVPADTATRTLRVYVGTYRARGQLRATLSDGGLAYTDTSLSNATNGPGGVYTLVYKANTPNQKLTVQWTLFQQNGTNGSGNVTLQAAALAGENPNNPPLIYLDAPSDDANFAVGETVSFAARASDLNGYVTNVSFFENGSVVGSTVSGPYALDWSGAGPGKYALKAVATDDLGASRSSTETTVYVHSSGGSLSATAAYPPSFVDLTAEGTADWIHLGSVTNTTFERKSGVSPKLNATVLGTNSLIQFSDAPTSYAWSDGTPTAANAGTTTGVYVYGYTNGFRVTAPADLRQRKLKVYLGCYGVGVKVESYVSDFSAPVYVDRSVQSDWGNDYAVYEIDYSAASPDQGIVVNFVTSSMFDEVWGNTSFSAATLQGGPPELRISSYWFDTGGFHLGFMTESGGTYDVEYCDTQQAGWNLLAHVTGTGGLVTVPDSASASGRLYRVVEH